ncbi:MAG TPA: hypothetical protein VNE40_00125 [Candidatus Dormibacteraeota bacterium]|nr:hypothetical protein [Candidatus Dormibacteraeota bacterium]
MKTVRHNELRIDELVSILGITIKHDEINKILTFICQLSALTPDSQLNISFNAPSSSGKSFIPIEVAKLFPADKVIDLGYTSPTSFFHSYSQKDDETGEYLVDLEGKILIFLDQPHNLLLEHLRPVLSHDKKEIKVRITDKQQKFGLRTKKITIRGYPAVIFCSAGLRFDEQEATRFLLLSPETSQEKIREGILASLNKSADSNEYFNIVELNPERAKLIGRINAINNENIEEIQIKSEDLEYIKKEFLGSIQMLKPRHQRDIKRIVAISKTLALLNLWHRSLSGNTIVVNRSDIVEAFRLWNAISVAQELNIPPYVYRVFEDVILEAFKDKNKGSLYSSIGVTRNEVLHKHNEVYGRYLDPLILRQQFIPILSQAGLITEEQDPSDKRKQLIYPLVQINSDTKQGTEEHENNIDLDEINRIFSS